MRNSLTLLCLFGGIAVSAVCPAQTTSTVAPPAPNATAPAAAPAPAASVIAKSEDATSIDLTVHDRKGRQITDLKAEELAVTDDGAPVKIASLRLVNDAPERMVSLVFGQLDPSAMKNARNVAEKLLKMFPDGPFTFAVFGVDGRLRLFQPYTTDRGAIVRAIEQAAVFEPASRESASSSQEKSLIAVAQAPSGSQPTVANAKAQSQAEIVYNALQQSQLLVQNQHIEPDLAGLTAIAQAERQLPGRKAILYFAQSAQPDVNTVDQMIAAAKAANQAGLSIYAIDMNAVDTQASDALLAASAMGGVAASNHLNAPSSLSGPPTGYVGLLGPAGAKAAGDNISNVEADGLAAAKGPLGMLSAMTGGVSVGFNENVKKPMLRMIGDVSSYYEVSYSPRIEIYDGKFRRVAVKAERPGIIVHARSGYYALPRGEQSAAQPIDATLASVFKAPTVPTDIAFRSTVLQFGKVEDGVASELAVEVPVANIDIHEDPNTDLFSFSVAVAARVEDKDGKVVHEFSEDFRRHGGLDTIDSARAGFVSFERRVTLAPGDYVLKTAVVDSVSGKAGAMTQPFHIALPPGQLSLSDVVLLRQTETAADTVRAVDGKIVPNLAGNVPAGAKDVSLFFLVHPAEKAAASPQVTVTISKDGKQLGQWPLTAASEKQKTLMPYLSALNTGALVAGSYDVTVSLKQGGEAAERHIAFVKEAGAVSDSTAAAPAVEAAGPATEAATPTILEAIAKTSAAPSPQQSETLIAAARKRALGYSAKLPNFMCIEVVDRSVDRSGKGHWVQQDTFSALLRYRDNAETRVVLEVNGHATKTEPDDMKGMHSNGEFGGLLKAIFDPVAEAKFTWESEKQISSGVVQVYSYQVAQKHSALGLTDNNNWTLDVAFHGELYIEPETGAVRFATVVAQDMPAKFTVRATAIQVVYDYIAINGHDYLLPVKGTVSLSEGKHQTVLNTLQFRDYKRFASQSRMLPVAETK